MCHGDIQNIECITNKSGNSFIKQSILNTENNTDRQRNTIETGMAKASVVGNCLIELINSLDSASNTYSHILSLWVFMKTFF